MFLLETTLRQGLLGEVPADKVLRGGLVFAYRVSTYAASKNLRVGVSRWLAGFFNRLYHALGQFVEVDESGLCELELFAAGVFGVC